MATPKDYAENLAIIWRMKDSLTIERMFRELGPRVDLNLETLASLEEIAIRSGIETYGFTPESLRERIEGPTGTAVLTMLQQILHGAQITGPCKEFLSDYVKTNLGQGTPPEMLLPLEQLGINLVKGQYGIFDPNSDLQEIESKLLEVHDYIISAYSVPALIKEALELRTKWHESFKQKYKSK